MSYMMREFAISYTILSMNLIKRFTIRFRDFLSKIPRDNQDNQPHPKSN